MRVMVGPATGACKCVGSTMEHRSRGRLMETGDKESHGALGMLILHRCQLACVHTRSV